MRAGGWSDYRLVQSLDIHNPTGWDLLPDLPTEVRYGAFVEDGDDLVLVNAYDDNLLRYDEGSQTFGVIEGQNVGLGGMGVAVVAVNDTNLHGCR